MTTKQRIKMLQRRLRSHDLRLIDLCKEEQKDPLSPIHYPSSATEYYMSVERNDQNFYAGLRFELFISFLYPCEDIRENMNRKNIKEIVTILNAILDDAIFDRKYLPMIIDHIKLAKRELRHSEYDAVLEEMHKLIYPSNKEYIASDWVRRVTQCDSYRDNISVRKFMTPTVEEHILPVIRVLDINPLDKELAIKIVMNQNHKNERISRVLA